MSTARRLDDAGSRPLGGRMAAILMAIASAIAFATILNAFRGLSFFYDEWDFVQGRRGWGLDELLAPHNEHLHLIPTLLFKVLFATFGIDSYWPFAVVLVLTHIACAWALFLLMQRWSGNEMALVGGIALLFLGTAWEVLLWPFEMGVTISLGAGLAALLLVERPSRAARIWTCVLLTVSVTSASLGIPLIIAAAVLLGLRPRALWNAWIILVPVIVYGAWYLAYGEPTLKAGNLPGAPGYAVDGAAGAAAGLFGLPLEFGQIIAVLIAVAILLALALRWPGQRRLIAVSGAALIMWVMLGLSRLGVTPPETSRYIYPGAAMLLVIGAVLVGRRRLQAPGLRLAIIVVLAGSLIVNIAALRRAGDSWRDGSAQVRAALGALELVRGRVPADYQPAPVWGPQIRAGTYLAAVDDLGSPAAPATAIPAYPAKARAGADAVLRSAGAFAIAPAPLAPGAAPVAIRSISGGTLRAGPGRGCRTSAPAPGATTVIAAAVPGTGLAIRAPGPPGPGRAVEIRAQRFADLGAGDPIARARPGGAALRAEVVAGGNTPPWAVQLSSAGPIAICSVAP